MANPNTMHNLTTLVKRLEAATSRLEDIASSVDGATSSSVGAAGLTGAARAPEPTTSTTAAPSQTIVTPVPEPKAEVPEEPLPRQIEAFDELIKNEVNAFVEAAGKIGGLVEQQAKAVQEGFVAERTYLLMTTKAKQPDPMNPDLFADIHKAISEVDEIKETNRPSPLFTHLGMVSEGVIGLGWIMEGRPTDHVDSALGGAQYNGNRVLKEYKEKDQDHVKYVQAYYKTLKSLSAFTKEHYRTGIIWNSKDGIDAVQALKQVQSSEATSKSSSNLQGSGAPPPPPPPPLPSFGDTGAPPPPPAPAAGIAKGGDMSAMFNQLNQGSSVTSGLRKVDKSEMTHKNPSLRADGGAIQRTDSSSSTRSKSPMPAKKPESLKGKKPGKKELEGSKWIVENFENTGNDIITITAELNHSILISRCSKCVIQVKGKANAISVDNCAGLSIIIDSLVSSIDVIKASKFAIEVNGVLPTILFDQVDGGQVFLQEQSMKSPPEILTSKCSAINIVTPPTKNDDDDSKETPLPEQLRSYFKDGKLLTEVVEHAG